MTAAEMRKMLARLANTPVQVRTLTARTAGGPDTHSDPVSYQAQIRRATKVQRDNVGVDADVAWLVTIPHATATVATTADPNGTAATVELPDGQVRPVVAVDSRRAPESDDQLALVLMIS